LNKSVFHPPENGGWNTLKSRKNRNNNRNLNESIDKEDNPPHNTDNTL